ncbi:hypothetical protein AK812_SmicGene42432 [Symbiodinium microadriaticum]|uniref:Uncharacterized protein n=1 Tax=Symbiodinium microadriaticum TaxID=2951 RepID=A0A1Q9C3K3_SYMMI|nr:hypothetical protein AK812_SmicGene42432 [Symbiodinium microadriaticum]CAE7189683.1 unnamed protein product [Symbiodinium microadriaticum]
MQEISRAAWLAACFRGGAGEVVKHLLSRRADVDFQLDLRRDHSRVGRLLYMAKALQHRRGRKTILSAWSYHMQGSTALMLAMQSANYEEEEEEEEEQEREKEVLLLLEFLSPVLLLLPPLLVPDIRTVTMQQFFPRVRLDLKNCRGWTAADFAKGQLIPAFLQQGLDGDPSECHRVAGGARWACRVLRSLGAELD